MRTTRPFAVSISPHSTRAKGDWKSYQDAGLFKSGFKFIVGEWSAALGYAHKCNEANGPSADEATRTATEYAQQVQGQKDYEPLHVGGLQTPLQS